jgi:hypothetical protein
MDKRELTLIDNALRAAQGFGLGAKALARAQPRKGARVGAAVEIRHGGRRVVYTVEAKRALAPATLGAALHELAQLKPPVLLVTDYVTPPMAERLREAGVEFLDGAGNAYLNQPPLLVWVKGQRPAAKPVAPEVGRAFQPGGLQVLFALLGDPAALNLPYRELARQAQVAHGTVGWVMADLQRLGFVRDTPGKRGTRRWLDGRRLLTQWAEAYARLLRPRMLIGRYNVETLDGWENWPLAEHGALWGGEPAGAIATGYLKPGELTLYAKKLPGRLAAQLRFIKEAGPGRKAVVEVRRQFWDFPGDARLPGMVPPLLIYADLLATGDGRCIETARMVYDEYLAGFFGEA